MSQASRSQTNETRTFHESLLLSSMDEHLTNCTTECPQCSGVISALQGSKDAICKNCGYKMPCCGD